MTELFLKVVNMSISASWLVLAILILRFVLKKAPKWVNVLLWGIVAVRLLCPFSIESALSLVPSAETISPEIMMNAEPSIHTGVPMINSVVNPVISQSFSPAPGDSANPLQIWIPVLAFVWVIGVGVLLGYTVISYWRLSRKVDTAVLYRENIFQSENIGSPFVLGIIRPKIYLPFGMEGQNLEHVVAHEQAHIGRKDHWWKPLGFLLLTIHWFNPLMWLAYVLLCRDIELACDEKVVQKLGFEQRADYSQALLTCSVNHRMVSACPLAFGEVGVKERVTSVLNYKKPAFWIVAASVIACVVVAVCFLTNPRGIKIEDITQEKGFTIAKQVKTDITLSVPKALLPDDIYTKEGCSFEENEVIAYQTDTSTIYLDRVMLANEGDEYLYFIFKCSYDLPESGSILFPYQIKGTRDHLLYSPVVMASSRTLTDDRRAYEDAVRLRGSGPDEQFTFYVDTEACKVAEGTIQIQMICNELTYVKNGSDLHKSSDVDETLGMRLALDDVIWLSKKGQNLSWEDFDHFPYIETGSGLYIRVYEIDEMFSLAIGGAGPNSVPMYIYLSASDGWEERIDIRTDDVASFIAAHKDNPVVKECTYGWQCSPVGYSQETVRKMLAMLGGIPDNMMLGSIRAFPVVRINSEAELQQFLAQMDKLNMQSTYPDVPAFADVLEAYEEEFFDSTTLFLTYITEGTTGTRHGVDYVRKTEDVLSIGISVSEPESGDTALEGWMMAIGVPKEQVFDVAEVIVRVSSTHCPDRGTESAELIRAYMFEESTDVIKPSIALFDDGTFQFTFSALSSYLGYGYYEIEGKQLTLNTSDGKYHYVFDMIEKDLIFDAEASSVQTWSSGLYDGAIMS